MRKALHIHMLIQLVGFSHPEDIFRGEWLPDVFKRLWYSTRGFVKRTNVFGRISGAFGKNFGMILQRSRRGTEKESFSVLPQRLCDDLERVPGGF